MILELHGWEVPGPILVNPAAIAMVRENNIAGASSHRIINFLAAVASGGLAYVTVTETLDEIRTLLERSTQNAK